MQNPGKQYGFSLTEVLITVAVLAVLMGALMGLGKRLSRQGQENLCRNTIQILVAAIEQYHEFHGKFPDQAANLYQQLYSLSQSRVVCEKIQKQLVGSSEFMDPWGKPLRYAYHDGWTFPVITSAGPDGYFGDEGPAVSGSEADNISSK